MHTQNAILDERKMIKIAGPIRWVEKIRNGVIHTEGKTKNFD